LDLYYGGAMFESWLGHCQSWQRFFLIFLSPWRQILGLYLKLGHRHFRPHSSKFIVYCHTVMQHCEWELLIVSVSKLQIENTYVNYSIYGQLMITPGQWGTLVLSKNTGHGHR
jgi:hypothetical protein